MPSEHITESRDYLPPSAFVKFLETEIFERHKETEMVGDFSVSFLDLTPLQLNAGPFIPFFIPKNLPVGKWVTADQIDALVDKIRGTSGNKSPYFVVLLIGNKVQYDPAKRRRNVGRHRIAIMDLSIMRQAYAAKSGSDDLKRLLAEALLQYLGPQLLSPYQHSTVAIAGRFFGRSDILDRVRTNRTSNFVFPGNRRIGKTSLLMEIRRQLLKDKQTETVWVYGNTCHSTRDVLSQIVNSLYPGSKSALEQRLEAFPALVQGYSAETDRDVAIFIDELDHILEFEETQNFDLLERLRGISQHDRCRVFMAGFRRTIDSTRKKEHPLYNFGQNKAVLGLSRKEIDLMVSGPLSRLGVPIDPNVVVSIENETAGHPELIQVFGEMALNIFERTGQQVSTTELVEAVLSDDTFREKVLGSFLSNFNPLEKLACYALFRKAEREGRDYDKFEFGIDDLDTVLKEEEHRLTESDCNTLLNNLHFGGAVLPIRSSLRYRIAVPQLGRYCQMLDLNRSIVKAKQDLQLVPHLKEALLHEPPRNADADAVLES